MELTTSRPTLAGLGPKLARAVVNHASTFLIYDTIIAFFTAREAAS